MTTPLHVAMMNRAHEFAEWLIRHGADVNAVNGGGDSPLHTAVSFVDTQLIALLLHSGANPEQKNKKGETPLFLLETVSKPL